MRPKGGDMKNLTSLLAMSLFFAPLVGGFAQHPMDSGQNSTPPGLGDEIMGSVTAVATDHLVIQNNEGRSLTILFHYGTRFLRQTAHPDTDGSKRIGPGGTPPQPIQVKDIQVGDTISVRGETSNNNTVSADLILQMNPQLVKQMREHHTVFGKAMQKAKSPPSTISR